MGKLLFYSKLTTNYGKQLQLVIEDSISDRQIEICRTIASLSAWLRQPGLGLCVAVLLATDMEDLDGLYALRDLLSNLRIILILPDRQKTTIAKGHKFYPRFLTSVDNDFIEIGAVLHRLLEIHDRGVNPGCKSR